MRDVDGAAALLVPGRALGQARVGFDSSTQCCGEYGVSDVPVQVLSIVHPRGRREARQQRRVYGYPGTL